MYNEIKEYIEPVLTGLKEIDAGFDVDMLPANQMDNYYFLKFESIEDEQSEAYSLDTVSVSIELWFLLSNKKDNYQKSIDKINTIKKELKNLNPYEDTFQILTPLNVKANNLNNIIKNNWLKANINFDLKILDD